MSEAWIKWVLGVFLATFAFVVKDYFGTRKKVHSNETALNSSKESLGGQIDKLSDDIKDLRIEIRETNSALRQVGNTLLESALKKNT